MVQFGQQEECTDSSPNAAEHIVRVPWSCIALGKWSQFYYQRGLRGLLCRWPSITEWEMYITAQGCRLRNDLYCVEWDVKLYYTIPYQFYYKAVSHLDNSSFIIRLLISQQSPFWRFNSITGFCLRVSSTMETRLCVCLLCLYCDYFCFWRNNYSSCLELSSGFMFNSIDCASGRAFCL